jgi:hypothetical protein
VCARVYYMATSGAAMLPRIQMELLSYLILHAIVSSGFVEQLVLLLFS